MAKVWGFTTGSSPLACPAWGLGWVGVPTCCVSACDCQPSLSWVPQHQQVGLARVARLGGRMGVTDGAHLCGSGSGFPAFWGESGPRSPGLKPDLASLCLRWDLSSPWSGHLTSTQSMPWGLQSGWTFSVPWCLGARHVAGALGVRPLRMIQECWGFYGC